MAARGTWGWNFLQQEFTRQAMCFGAEDKSNCLDKIWISGPFQLESICDLWGPLHPKPFCGSMESSMTVCSLPCWWGATSMHFLEGSTSVG